MACMRMRTLGGLGSSGAASAKAVAWLGAFHTSPAAGPEAAAAAAAARSSAYARRYAHSTTQAIQPAHQCA